MDKIDDTLSQPSSSSTLVSNSTKFSFGEYLTSQYALLEQTLSYLGVDDLFNALLVCKSWSQTVNNLFRKQRRINRIRWHVDCEKDCPPRHCFSDADNIRFKSQLILAFTQKPENNFVEKELLKNSPYTAAGNDIFNHPVPGLYGDLYLILSNNVLTPWCSNVNSSESSAKYSHLCCGYKQYRSYFGCRAVAIFFPEIDGCIVNSFFATEDDYDNDECSMIVEKILAPSARTAPLKGILVFDVDCSSGHWYLIEPLLHDVLMNNDQRLFAIGGGLFSKMHKSLSPWMESCQGVLLVCFYGENVRCYSTILFTEKREDIKNFMKLTRDTLGGIDRKTQQRVAFVFRCVGRSTSNIENGLYYQYFPDTPAFVFSTHAEFGPTDDPDESTKAKKSKLNLPSPITECSYCTVYFFVTIDLPV